MKVKITIEIDVVVVDDVREVSSRVDFEPEATAPAAKPEPAAKSNEAETAETANPKSRKNMIIGVDSKKIDDFIKLNYATMGVKDIAEQFHISDANVYYRANKLGLKKQAGAEVKEKPKPAEPDHSTKTLCNGNTVHKSGNVTVHKMG